MKTPNQPPVIDKNPKTWLILAVLVAISLVYLISNHWLHVLDALPYVLVIAMLVMHMGGHGGHNHGGKNRE